jgi:SRSO17 transposase
LLDEAVRDDLRDYVIDAFSDPNAVLILDEADDGKKSVHSVGVQCQYPDTAGRIENAQVGVYLTYAAGRSSHITGILHRPKRHNHRMRRCST